MILCPEEGICFCQFVTTQCTEIFIPVRKSEDPAHCNYWRRQSDNLIVPAESDLVSEPVCYNTYKVEWPERECGRKIRTLSQLRMVWPSCLKESLRNPQRQIYDCRCIERYVICWGEGSFDIWAIVALPYDMYLLTWSVYSYCLMYHKDKPQNKLLRLMSQTW